MAYTALVAEDDELLRMVAVGALEDAGFDVLEAANADEALACLHAQGPSINLLFTDIHMPGTMDGLSLARQARREWPNIAILISSGNTTPKSSLLPEGSRFLIKPYNISNVTRIALDLLSVS